MRAPNSNIGEYVSFIFNVKISDDMRAWLKDFAAFNKVSQSQIVREALRNYRAYYDQFEPPPHQEQ